MRKLLLALLCGVLSVSAVAAVKGTFLLGVEGEPDGKTPETAIDYFNPDYWVDGIIPSGTNSVAFFTNKVSGLLYVKVDRDLDIGRIVRSPTGAANQLCLIGDGKITFYKSIGDLLADSVRFYNDVEVKYCVGDSNRYLMLEDTAFCGGFVNRSVAVVYLHDDNNYFRLDYQAKSPDEVIDEPWTFGKDVYVQDGSYLRFVAPVGQKGTSALWDRTEGSCFMHRLADTAHPISAGGLVSGDGIAPGTFVRRVFDDATIELSQPATATVDDTEVTFAPFSPKVHQTIPGTDCMSRTSYMTRGVVICKSQEEDEFVVDCGSMDTARHFYFRVDTKAGYEPGTFVIHNCTYEQRLDLGTCNVAFGTVTGSAKPGFHLAPVRMFAADDVARLTVTNGIAASIEQLTNVIGRLVKDGAGTLTVGLSATVNGLDTTGKLAVEEGTLAIDCAGTELLHVKSLELGAAGTLAIPACGVRCDALTAESGARIEGTGRFYIPEAVDLSGISFGEDVTVIRVTDPSRIVRADDIVWDRPAAVTEATLPGDPAVWLDITSHATDITIKEGTTVSVDAWADRRGAGYPIAKNAGTCPTIQTNAEGKVRFVNFRYAFTGSQSGAQSFLFRANEQATATRKFTGIRHVFKVMCLGSGRPQPMGNSDMHADAGAYSSPVFTGVSALISNTTFRVNGETRDWRNGYPYPGGTRTTSSSGGYLLTSPVDKAIKSVVEYAVPSPGAYASGLGWSGKNNGYGGGCENLYECIVYTNELTATERLQVTDYLMRKWLAGEADVVPTEGETAEADGSNFTVPDADQFVNLETLSGEGRLGKYGDGTLALGNLRNAQASLDVEEGRVRIRSQGLDGQLDLPFSPYLHVDAGATETITVTGGKVSEWRDVRGAGYPAATPVTAGNGPTVTTEGELSFVNFGTPRTGKTVDHLKESDALKFDPVADVHTVVAVADTTAGGGYLLGSSDMTHGYKSNYSLYGLWRGNANDGVHTLASALVRGASYTEAYYAIQCCTRGAGAPWGRLNGEDVDLSSATFTGDVDLFSFTDYENLNASAFNQIATSATYMSYGGQKLGESIIFTNALCRSSVRKIEAYLRKKWFGADTPEFSNPASMGVLKVAADAEVEIVGGAPLTVTGLKGAGTVDGAVAFAADAVFTVTVGEDGSVSVPTVSGGLDVSAGGTVLLVGAPTALEPGTYDLGAVKAAETYGTWTAVTETPIRRDLSVAVSDGHLVLAVTPRGAVLLIK